MTEPTPGDSSLNASQPTSDGEVSSALARHFPWGPRLIRRPRLMALLAVVVIFVWWFVPPVYRLLHGPVVVTRYGHKFGENKVSVGPASTGWMSTQKISKHALHAVIAAEDGKFYDHHGFDLAAIRTSYNINQKRQRYARGGSTISQQVVKMAFLGREKTLLRKTREAIGTLLMELILPKDKILEWYINLAEFGDGVYGIEEGCWHYFKTKPELMTIEQAVNLALVLPSPNNWSKGLRLRTLTPFGHKRFAAILNTMRSMGFITRPQWIAAITRGDFGRPIRGYAQLLADEESHKTLCPGSPDCPEGDDGVAEDDDTDDVSFPKAGPESATPLPGEQSSALPQADAPTPPPPADLDHDSSLSPLPETDSGTDGDGAP